MWVRGLKRECDDVVSKKNDVAPHVGAWIETCKHGHAEVVSLSHPMWVRGLKLVSFAEVLHRRTSHPMWVRGLKPDCATPPIAPKMSHPMWVRGLKHYNH